MQAIILAGGMGTRLGSLVRDKPKPLLEVDGNPFLLKIIDRLVNQGISDVIFCVGYRAQEIVNFFGDGAKWGINILYSFEEKLLGTGGAIRGVLHLINSPHFLVLNGDSFCHFNVCALIESHKKSGLQASLTLLETDNPARFGVIEFDCNNRILSFIEKNKLNTRKAWINAGVYVLSKELISKLDPCRVVSLEREVFPKYISDGLHAFLLDDNRFIDIGTPRALNEAEFFFKRY